MSQAAPPTGTNAPEGAPIPTPLKGEVCTQYIRCNKAGCRCQTGSPHGPYYYRVWREGGHVRKVYVKSEDLAAVRAACDSYKALNQQLRDLRLRREQAMRDIRGQCRRAQRLLRSPEKAESRPAA